jgi:hypothetical protein
MMYKDATMIDCGVNAIINICDRNEFDSGKSFVHTYYACHKNPIRQSDYVIHTLDRMIQLGLKEETYLYILL